MNAHDSQFKIATTQVNEPPELNTLGAFSTGYHGVSLTMVSVAPNLEVLYNENASLADCLAQNQADAAGRNVLWDPQDLTTNGNMDEYGAAKPLVPTGILVGEDRVLLSVQDVLEGARDEDELMGVARQVGLVVESPPQPERVVVAKSQQIKDKGKKSQVAESDNDLLRQAVSLISHSCISYEHHID